MSTNAQTSCRWVAAARAANNTLVRPDEAGPQISVKHPRGSPPVSASISRTPLETICGVGRTSNRDAGVTPASLGIAAKRSKTSVPATPSKRPTAAVETSGTDDMETSGFQGTSGPRPGSVADIYFRLLFAMIVILRAGVVKHLKINLRIEFGADAAGIQPQESEGTSRLGSRSECELTRCFCPRALL